jgi:hypothetical protein
MPTLSRLTALAVARAILAGSPSAAGLAARTRACLDADAVWALPIAQRCARLPGEHWRRLPPRTLASWIERDPGYGQAWAAKGAGAKPHVRRYILRERTGMQPPLGLGRFQLPYWPHTATLAEWLGIPDAGMWRLTRAAGWQRRICLGEQHYRYQLLARSGSQDTASRIKHSGERLGAFSISGVGIGVGLAFGSDSVLAIVQVNVEVP